MSSLLEAARMADVNCIDDSRRLLVPVDILELGVLRSLCRLGCETEAHQLVTSKFRHIHERMCEIYGQEIYYYDNKSFNYWELEYTPHRYFGYRVKTDTLYPVPREHISRCDVFNDDPARDKRKMFILVFEDGDTEGYKVNQVNRNELKDVLYTLNYDVETRVYHSFKNNAPLLGHWNDQIADMETVNKDLDKYYNEHDEFMAKVKSLEGFITDLLTIDQNADPWTDLL